MNEIDREAGGLFVVLIKVAWSVVLTGFVVMFSLGLLWGLLLKIEGWFN